MSVNATLFTPVRASFLVRYRTRVGAVLALCTIAMLLFVHPRWVDDPTVGFILDTLGLALVIGGVLWRLWCILYIGGRKSTMLQSTGPYSLVRHPLYVGSLLLGLGLAALAQNPLLLFWVLLYFWVQYSVTIRHEEAALAQLFGEAHADYVRRVPCFIPRFAQFDPTPPESINLGSLRNELRYSIVFIAFIPITKLVYLLQAHGIFHPLLFP